MVRDRAEGMIIPIPCSVEGAIILLRGQEGLQWEIDTGGTSIVHLLRLLYSGYSGHARVSIKMERGSVQAV